MSPSKILAVKLRAMGDTVLMTAPLIELSKAFPQSEIHVLVPTPWTSLLDGFPKVHKVWSLDSSKKKLGKLSALTKLGLHLRKEKFDCVVHFHASSSSATLTRLINAPIRSIHFHGHTQKNQYSTVEIPGKGTLKPIIERDMDAIRALGVHVPAGRTPKIFIQPGESEKAKQFLKDLHLTPPILGIGLGASRPTKSWPIERYASLAIEWFKKTRGSAIAFASASEEHLVQEFLHSANDQSNYAFHHAEEKKQFRYHLTTAHQLSLRNLAAVLSELSVFAGNDSGPRHLATAVSTPTVTLFGPEHPFEWHPYPQDKHPYLFIESLPCRRDADLGMPPWCGIERCTVEEHRCMKQIGVDSVLEKCLAVARSTG